MSGTALGGEGGPDPEGGEAMMNDRLNSLFVGLDLSDRPYLIKARESRDFGLWALEAWPALSDTVLDASLTADR